MNVSMNTAVQGNMQSQAPPSSDQMAARMANAVENGDIDIEQLQANLSERLGVEDTSSIVAEDGQVNGAALAELLEQNMPAGGPGGPGGPSGPPPGGPPPGGPPPSGESSEESTVDELLTEILSEEELEELTEADGSYDMDALVTALREQLSANDQSDTGNLLSLVA